MSEIVDLLISQTDPVTALLLIVLSHYVRNIDKRLQDEIRRVRQRVNRLEDSQIADSVLARADQRDRQRSEAETDGGRTKSDGFDWNTSDDNSES